MTTLDHPLWSTTSGAGLDFYDAQLPAADQEDERNIAKYGNVVPVKVDPAEHVLPGHERRRPVPLHMTVVKGNMTGDA